MEPFHRTIAPFAKLVPVTSSVKFALPAAIDVGLRAVIFRPACARVIEPPFGIA